MRLGIMSDVHCNSAAMQLALDELAGSVDEVVLAGDAVLQYRFSDPVVEGIRRHDIRYIQGNHEMALLGDGGRRALAGPEIHRPNVEFMAEAPKRIRTRCSGKSVLVVHGSPFAPYGEYLHRGSPGLARCAELDVDVLILGHTHVPMTARVGNVLVVNPGSLGQCGDPGHPDMVSYAVLDTDSEEVVFHRFRNPLLVGA